MSTCMESLLGAWVEKRAVELGASPATLPRGYGCDGYEILEVPVDLEKLYDLSWKTSFEEALISLIGARNAHVAQGFSVTPIRMWYYCEPPRSVNPVAVLGYSWKRAPGTLKEK